MTNLKSISEKLAAWRRYREAVRELSPLSDRELATSASAAATSRRSSASR